MTASVPPFRGLTAMGGGMRAIFLVAIGVFIGGASPAIALDLVDVSLASPVALHVGVNNVANGVDIEVTHDEPQLVPDRAVERGG